MEFKLDTNSLILITGLTILVLLTYGLSVKSNIHKFVGISITMGIYIYSGLGIASNNVNDKYIVSYIIYLSSVLIPIYLSYKLKIRNKKSKEYDEDITLFTKKYEKAFFIASILFFICLIVYLIIPIFRLNIIVKPPISSAYNQRKYIRLFEKDNILNIIDILKVLLLPIFLVYLNLLITKNRKIKAIIMIYVWVYLEFLKYEYMSRSQMLVFIAFSILVVSVHNKDIILKKKLVLGGMIGLILSLPMLAIYENYRLGLSVLDVNLLDSIVAMVSSEISYPKFYDTILSRNSIYTIETYFTWLFTLPIPKGLLGITIPTINASFTSMINSSLDYIILPSILGEAFMVFGKHLFWIHGLIMGGVIGVTLKIVKKSHLLIVVGCYITVLAFSIGRGGSTQIISFCINGLLSLWLLKLVIKFIRFINRSLYSQRKKENGMRWKNENTIYSK